MEDDGQPTLESLDNRIQELEEDIRQYTTFVQHYIETRRKEVDRLIAYEKGDAMRVRIQKMDGTSFCMRYGLSLRRSCDCVQVFNCESPKISDS